MFFSASQWQLRKTQLFWILQIAGWLAFGAAMFRWALDLMSARDALVNKVLLVSIGFTITLFLRELFRNVRSKSSSPIARLLVLLCSSFAAAALWREIHSLLFLAYYNFETTGIVSAESAAIPIGTFLYDGFVMLTWSLLYYSVTTWMELEEQRERATRAEGLAQTARLRALQSQLEPHFLFNTLNAISTLVVSGRSDEATRMIARLSDFLRLSLETSDTPEIPLTEELEFVRRYLDIEQVRFGSRLRVKIDADPAVMKGMVPALLLQPLVENAIKHGILPRETGGSISVTTARNNGAMHLTVADDGPGMKQDPSAAPGLGLRNTVTRLRELYGDSAKLTLGSSACGGLEARIELPFRPANSVDDECDVARGR